MSERRGTYESSSSHAHPSQSLEEEQWCNLISADKIHRREVILSEAFPHSFANLQNISDTRIDCACVKQCARIRVSVLRI